jgi:hypothetical protein
MIWLKRQLPPESRSMLYHVFGACQTPLVKVPTFGRGQCQICYLQEVINRTESFSIYKSHVGLQETQFKLFWARRGLDKGTNLLIRAIPTGLEKSC